MVIGSVNITMLAPYSIDFTRAAMAASQLFKLIDRVSLIDPFDRSGEQPSETTGLVELENVGFAYPTRPAVTVLDNFSLTVPAGKVTALVVRAIFPSVWCGMLTSQRAKAVPEKAPSSASLRDGTICLLALSGWMGGRSTRSTSVGSGRMSGSSSR